MTFKMHKNMKKIITIFAAVLVTVCASAQEGRAIYNKYSDKPGVEAVYISPAMFKLIGNLPEIKVSDSELDIVPIVKSLSGFYLLDVGTQVAPTLSTDVKKALQNGKYELMMEAKDGGDKVSIFVVDKGDVITSFVLLDQEKDGSTTFICLDGAISRKDFNALVSSAMKD